MHIGYSLCVAMWCNRSAIISRWPTFWGTHLSRYVHSQSWHR